MTRERIMNINSSPYFYPCTLQLEITDCFACFACFACIFIELARQSESYEVFNLVS